MTALSRNTLVWVPAIPQAFYCTQWIVWSVFSCLQHTGSHTDPLGLFVQYYCSTIADDASYILHGAWQHSIHKSSLTAAKVWPNLLTGLLSVVLVLIFDVADRTVSGVVVWLQVWCQCWPTSVPTMTWAILCVLTSDKGTGWSTMCPIDW